MTPTDALFERLGGETLEGLGNGIDRDARILEGYHTQNGLDIRRSEDDLRYSFRTDEADSRKSVLVLDGLTVCRFIDSLSFRSDAGRTESICRSHTIHRNRVDQALRFVGFSPTAQSSHSHCDVS